MSELAQVMQEPAGGHSRGRKATTNPEVEGRHAPLAAEDWQAQEFARQGGWTVITDVPGTEARGGGWQRSGGTSHRGVVHPDEYVDEAVIEGMVERELGFTLEQLHSVYSTGGRIPSDRRELRGRIDARLLALSRSGANMDLFSRVTGLAPRTLDRALSRARAEEGGHE